MKPTKQKVYFSTEELRSIPIATSIPKEKWGVHETHCCSKHGCKYGHKDCPVAINLTIQEYPCEICDEDMYDGYESKEGYFFTREELNEYTSSVIERALEIAAKEAYTKFVPFTNDEEVDEQSIIDTFEQTFKEFKV